MGNRSLAFFLMSGLLTSPTGNLAQLTKTKKNCKSLYFSKLNLKLR